MGDSIPHHHLLNGVERRDELLSCGAYNKAFLGQWRGTRVALVPQNVGNSIRDDVYYSPSNNSCFNEYLRRKELTHPNIIQVFGIARPANHHQSPVVVTEYLCCSLRQRYNRKPLLDRSQQAAVSLGVASALEYLHERQTVCGNVAAHTIMVCEAGGVIKAKLSIIGCTYLAEGDRLLNGHSRASETQSSAVAITHQDPATMCNGTGPEKDSREADCMALGAVMLEMCALREPHVDGTADLTVIRDHPLRTIIEACLESDLASRPTATKLCEQLLDVTKQLADPIRDSRPEHVAKSKGSLVHDDSLDCGLEGIDEEEQEVPRICQKPPDEVDTLANQVFQVDTKLHQFHSPTYENVSVSFVTSKQSFTARPGFCLTRKPVQRSKRQRPRNRSEYVNVGYNGSQDTLQEGPSKPRSSTDGVTGARGKNVPPAQQLEEALAALVSTPAGRGRQLHPPIDPDLISISQKDTADGMAARCKRVFGDESYDLPAWSQFATFPENAIGCCSLPCVFDGYLFAAFQVATTATTFGRAELFRLALAGSDDSRPWERVPLPPGRWHYHCYLLAASSSLYAVVVGEHLSGEYSIFRMISFGVWHLVTRLPVRKFDFGVTTIESLLFVIGGRDDAIWTGSASRSVHVTDLAANSAWIPLPTLPRDCVSPRVVARDSVIHCLGYNGDLQDNLCDVLSLDLGPTVMERRWDTATLCETPGPYCGAAVVNGHFVLTGGKRSRTSSESLAAAYVYLEELMRWLPLPSLQTARRGAHCMAWKYGLLCLAGVHEHASTTASVRDMESLPNRGADLD